MLQLRLIEEEEARIRSVQEDEDALLLETRRSESSFRRNSWTLRH